MDLFKTLKKQSITLTQEEIKVLFNDRDKNSDKIARSQFKLIIHLVQKFRLKYSSLTDEEMISAAMLGIAQAIKYYNQNNETDTDFTIYLYNTIIQRFTDEFREKQIIKMPVDKDKLEIYKNIKAINVSDVLTNRNNKDENEEISFFETYIKEEDDKLKEDLERYDNLCKIIKETFKDKQRWADIIIANFGLCGVNEKLSQEEIGEMFGVSKQAVNQIKLRALEQLKNNKEFIEYLKQTYHE